MGIPYSTARWVAPASFLFDFAAQQYGMLSTPNMKDVHDANPSFFSPQPYAVALFFFPQQLAQLWWLWRLWRRQGSERDVREMVDYVPVYALGNVCIGAWMFFWNSSHLRASNAFVALNTISQLAYLTTGRLGPLRTSSPSSALTHVVAKTFAGIGVLDLLHNTSAAYFPGVLSPGAAVRVLTGVGFAVAGAASDWILGGCLVYDLLALAVGQREVGEGRWAGLLGAYAVGTAAVVGLGNWVM
ncbi:concanavalin a-like lectins glucanase [Diplodia corticola]|uniref:Concanavalin a-like lectins glucanase n=1 Tax=Diplodia corticola TaxID=236234 RepID=A0A1J9RY18_9PEZI|nr:concanavalin a-like lectins glucanase [Diplodia corticola]OJD33247.1 concanavalin a-like lectins glucanase [Diplodia corticola]